MTTEAQTTIDPCPLCRGRSELSNRLGEGWWQVICQSCGCRTGEIKHATPERVIAAWNTRPTPPAIVRSISEYHEDMGDVLWWCFERPRMKCSMCGGDGNICVHSNLSDVKCEACNGEGYTEGSAQLKGEPPYVGSPNDLGFTVEAHTTTRVITQMDQEHDPEPVIHRINVGGWPGYHTHWTPLPEPREPPIGMGKAT
jgi:hypothetical protein